MSTSKNHNLKKSLLISAVVFCLPAISNAEGTAKAGNKWRPHLELNAKAGTKRHIGRIGALAPLFQNDDSMVFADLRFMADSRQNQEGNFGLGYRFLATDAIYGVYGYYDRRHTKFGSRVNQATFGVERLSDTWDVRANVYLPQKKTKIKVDSKAPESYVPGTAKANTVVTAKTAQKEVPLRGLDLEIGRTIPGVDGLRLLGSGYFYQGRDGAKSIKGVQIRSTYKLNDNVSFEVSTNRDNVRKTNAYVGVDFKLALGAETDATRGLSTLSKRMTDAPIRDVDIITNTAKHEIKTTKTGQFFVNSDPQNDVVKAAAELKAAEEALEAIKAAEEATQEKANDFDVSAVYSETSSVNGDKDDAVNLSNDAAIPGISSENSIGVNLRDVSSDGEDSSTISSDANSETQNEFIPAPTAVEIAENRIEAAKTKREAAEQALLGYDSKKQDGTAENPFIKGTPTYETFLLNVAGGANKEVAHVHTVSGTHNHMKFISVLAAHEVHNSAEVKAINEANRLAEAQKRTADAPKQEDIQETRKPVVEETVVNVVSDANAATNLSTENTADLTQVNAQTKAQTTDNTQPVADDKAEAEKPAAEAVADETPIVPATDKEALEALIAQRKALYAQVAQAKKDKKSSEEVQAFKDQATVLTSEIKALEEKITPKSKAEDRDLTGRASSTRTQTKSATA